MARALAVANKLIHTAAGDTGRTIKPRSRPEGSELSDSN